MDRCTTQPCSPDLAPADYHLFSYLQRHLDGQDFDNYDDIKNAPGFLRLPARNLVEGMHNLRRPLMSMEIISNDCLCSF
ncbi:unnamed protein product [Strongylus vulgaris]|uniref:Uncharacterized protein n=1 Tax=Strongylus vulgaris TaxID=40348 RepID=A0A3P7I2F7_STRVU|nr:unnamed protein product [Strongylus vulgaris]